MERLSHFLGANWFGLVLLAVGAVLGALLLTGHARRKTWSLPLLLTGAAFALLGLGGLVLPVEVGLWLGGAALAVLFGMLLVVIITGQWWAPLGYAVGALALLGIGGAGVALAGDGLREVGRLAISLEPTQPWWLVLLLLLPVIVLLSYKSLAGLGPVRRWVAIGLRCSLILLLTLALAEVRLRHQNESITALFLVDRSLSIPEDIDPNTPPDSLQAQVDRRKQRIENFINTAVETRGPGHERDRAGLILFGRRPRLELPPSDAPKFNFHFKDAASTVDGTYTDIAAAIKLALASFPEGSGKRIILLSDGNENLGNAEEQARIAERNGVQIDVVPLAAGHRNENEVLVQAVEAPPQTEQGSRLPIRVLVRSYNPRTVFGTLTLKQISQGEAVPVAPSPMRVRVTPGLNAFRFKQPLANEQQTYTYQAVFQPEGVETESGEIAKGLPGDRVQNNSATTHVIASGQRRILLIEPIAGDHAFLADRLRGIGNSKYKVYTVAADQLPKGKGDLGAFLSNYDCVLMANVPAELINDEQQEVIRSNTHDQGCGFIMVGGPDGFGAGGWQGTAIEKALPVDCDIKAIKVQGKGGLVMIMHACEMPDGNRWQKEIAKLAIRKLSPMDEVGIIDYDWKHKWVIPLQLIGGKRNSLMAIVDRMTPGDMPDFDTPIKMGYQALIDPARNLATKHMIIISDGDPQLTNQALLTQMRAKPNNVTVTTVCITTHGVPAQQNMKAIADKTGGRFYNVTTARALPSIYIKETRIVSQSFVYEKQFQPKMVFKGGPTDGLPDSLPPLYGYVRTTPKDSPLVEMPIVAPQGQEMPFPILAYWHYGLGKSVAFTSDARSLPDKNRIGWDRDWARSELYSKYWEQVIDWALRPVESRRLVMTTEYRDGVVRVMVDARDEQNRPITDLTLRGGVTPPESRADDPRRQELKFEQKNSGQYEATFKAEEAGSYFLNAQATRRVKTVNKDGKPVEIEEAVDGVRSGVTIPYSPEFADLETNRDLLTRLREITGGKEFADNDAELEAAARGGEAFRPGLPRFKNLQPVWYWLVFLCGTLLFFDVAVRRIALSPSEVAASSKQLWDRLRGHGKDAAQTPQYFDRLKSRKAAVGELLQQARAARRFEGGDVPVAAPPPGADVATAAPRPAGPRPAISPDKPKEEAADYASRLLKAKKRVWQEREEDKNQ
jgi:uncharacterized membrane protein